MCGLLAGVEALGGDSGVRVPIISNNFVRCTRLIKGRGDVEPAGDSVSALADSVNGKDVASLVGMLS